MSDLPMIPWRVSRLVDLARVDALYPVQVDTAIGCRNGDGVLAIRSPWRVDDKDLLELVYMISWAITRGCDEIHPRSYFLYSPMPPALKDCM